MTCIQKGWRMQMILKFLSSNGKSLPSSNQTWQWKILICRDDFPSYKPSFTDDFQLPPLITGRYIINFIFVTFPNSSIPNKPEFRMIHQPQWPKKSIRLQLFFASKQCHICSAPDPTDAAMWAQSMRSLGALCLVVSVAGALDAVCFTWRPLVHVLRLKMFSLPSGYD